MTGKKFAFRSGDGLRLSVVASTMIVLFGILGALWQSPALAGSEFSWQKDLQKGIGVAHTQHKFVLADVYTDWCGWCKRLDADTFSDHELQTFLNSNFVLVKVNAEDGGAGQKAASEYGVHGYPCGLVFNQDGRLVGRISGYKNASDYRDALTQIMNKGK